MADEKFDVFADRMIDLVKELRGETTELNKEMEGAKKQTKGMLDFLTKTDSRFVKFSKLAMISDIIMSCAFVNSNLSEYLIKKSITKFG